jgi:hypothetical protein
MALTKCKECGNEVSEKAAACPKCGAPVKSPPRQTLGCGTAIVIVVALFAFGMWVSDYRSTPTTPQARAPETQRTEPTPENPAHDLLMKRSDTGRNVAFAALMMAGGEHCGAVTRNFFQGFHESDAFWNITCTDGRSWVVTVKGDAAGSTQILDCAVLKVMGAGECFTKF